MSRRRRGATSIHRMEELLSYHDVLLRDGPITLPMQRAKINRWVEDIRDANH